MQQQCSRGLEEVKKAVESGSSPPDAVALRHSNEVLSVHKACLTLAEEKVFLAVQTYDLVSGCGVFHTQIIEGLTIVILDLRVSFVLPSAHKFIIYILL